MSVFKPIRIFWQNGMTKKQIDHVAKAVKKVLDLADAADKIEIQIGKPMSLWRYKRLASVRTVGLKIYLNADRLMDGFANYRSLGGGDYYGLLIVNSPMYALKGKERVLISGFGRLKTCALVYTEKLWDLNN